MGQDKNALYSSAKLAFCETTALEKPCRVNQTHRSPQGIHWPGCFDACTFEMTLSPTRDLAYLKMKEGKELVAGPEQRHRDLKGFYNSISSAAASELVFFPY